MGYGGSLGSDVNGMGLGIGGWFTRLGFALQLVLFTSSQSAGVGDDRGLRDLGIDSSVYL